MRLSVGDIALLAMGEDDFARRLARRNWLGRRAACNSAAEVDQLVRRTSPSDTNQEPALLLWP